MADYSQVLALITRSDDFQAQLKERFSALQSENGQQEKLDLILGKLLEHYSKHNPQPMIAETDLQGVITEVNDAFCLASKYAAEELIGQNINILRSSLTEEGVFTDLWNHITEGKPWNGTLQNRAKDYETYAIDILIIPINGPDGKPQKYWSIAFDISERTAKQEELQAKVREVHESLVYAKRIQRTILPDKKVMDEHFSDWMVIWRPKDVVSGDFWWFSKNIRTLFVAVVDCTGHGVPGAFMSLIGFNLLNQIVNERKIVKPGDILTELHKGVRTTLKQDEKDSKSRDGMDVSLIAIDMFDDSFEYAGAMRPLYFWHDGELETIKGDKQSIGGEQMEEERIFSTEFREWKEGDSVYLFSDGFVDQFGGPEQKKFSTKQLKQLIAENQHEEMSVQRALFNIVWKDWLGDDEQIDDVTLIGIKNQEAP